MKFPGFFLSITALAAPVFAQGVAQNGPDGPGVMPERSGQYPHFPSTDYGPPAPATLTIPAGRYLTVRVNGYITSNHSQPGDFFSATLVEPLVIDGFVVAARGQQVDGRVVDVQKAGRVKGVSSMRVELTELNLVDGQQVPFKSQMIYRKGQTSVGNDVAAIGGTAAVGAAIGAAATGDGLAAGIGAIAGGVAATIGVLSTRGRPTVIGPETLLTFRVEQPVLISTARSGGAFGTVAREDYQAPRPSLQPRYNGGPGPYSSPYPYYGGPYLNTGFFFYGGPRWYGRGYYGRGYYGRRW